MHLFRLQLCLLLPLFSLARLISAADFPAKVVHIILNGDMSIILNEEKEAIKIGLSGIDYQGKSQDFEMGGARGALPSLLPLFFASCSFL